MNEFTNEELKDLKFCVLDHTGYQGDSIHKNLLDKIQAMIDAYHENPCQHTYGLMHPINPDNQKYVCLNCDEVK